MEKFGDFIPLIVLALISLYSFAKKAGKKEVNTQEENKKQPVVTKTPSEHKRFSLDTVPDNVFQPGSFISATLFNEGMDKMEEELSPIFIEEVTDNAGLSVDFSNMEELKKGIVYAEIFNRKY